MPTDDGFSRYPDSLTVAADLVNVPDNCTPLYGVTIVAFADSLGNSTWAVRYHGDAPYSSHIGLMAMHQHQMVHAANPTCPEDESYDREERE